MNGYHSKQPRFWRGLSLAIGLTGVLLWPTGAIAQDGALERSKQESTRQESASANNKQQGRPEVRQEQPLSWARIDFILNEVQFVPRRARARTARIADVLGIGDALRTLSEGNAELRFNDGSEVRIGELATFRFTPNTRNFQLTDGTALFLIPPERGKTTIQTPNAVTGIQGSALFVRYIEATDTTIVGALTDNPDGPMVLYTEDGTQQRALYSNQVGVVEGDRITEVYDLDARMFWETSGLAETFDYKEDAGSADELDGVRREIREAIDSQEEFEGDNIVENPEKFSRPDTEAQAPVEDNNEDSVAAPADDTREDETESEALEEGSETDDTPDSNDSSEDETDLVIDVENAEDAEDEIQFEGSPAEEFHNQNKRPVPAEDAVVPPSSAIRAEDETDDETASAGNSNGSGRNTNQSGNNASNPGNASRPNVNRPNASGEQPTDDRLTAEDDTDDDLLVDDAGLPDVPDSETPEVISPPDVAEGNNRPNPAPIARPNRPTGGAVPLPPAALTDGDEEEPRNDPMTEDEESGGNEAETPATGNDSTGDTSLDRGDSSDGTDSPIEGNDAESDPANPTTDNPSDDSLTGGEGTDDVENLDPTLNNGEDAGEVEGVDPVEDAAQDDNIDEELVIPEDELNPTADVNDPVVSEDEPVVVPEVVVPEDEPVVAPEEVDVPVVPEDESVVAPEELDGPVVLEDEPVVAPEEVDVPVILEDEPVVAPEELNIPVVPEDETEPVEVIDVPIDEGLSSETSETADFEPTPEVTEDLSPEIDADGFTAGEIPAIEQPVEEAVPFTVDDFSEGQETMMVEEGDQEMMNMDDMEDANTVENATLSNTTELR